LKGFANHQNDYGKLSIIVPLVVGPIEAFFVCYGSLGRGTIFITHGSAANRGEGAAPTEAGETEKTKSDA
jgi:hypothetical protein